MVSRGRAVWAAVLLAVASLAPAQPRASTAADLAVTAHAWLDGGVPTDTAGSPRDLHFAVTVRNRRPDTVRVSLDACYGQLLVFADRARGPIVTVGTTDGDRAAECLNAPRAVTLTPGASHSDTIGFHAGAVLESVPADGKYHTTVRYRVADSTVVRPAGVFHLTRGLDRVRLAARSAVVGVAPSALEVRVVARNVGGRPVRLEYGACALTVAAYRSAARTGTPAWRSTLSAPRRPPPAGRGGTRARVGRRCPMYLASASLAPGDTLAAREFVGRWTMDEVLSDSLPEGRYHLRATLRLNWTTSVVDAGAVVLRRARAALPTTRRAGDLIARVVATRAAVGPGARADSLEVRFTVENRGARSRTVVALGGSGAFACPVRLAAYPDSAARDRGPAGGEEPRWFAPTFGVMPCPVYVPPIVLSPGASRTFDGRVLAPTRGELGGPRAHYAATLSLEDRSQVNGEPLAFGALRAGSTPARDVPPRACVKQPSEMRVTVYVGEPASARPVRGSPDSVAVLLVGMTGAGLDTVVLRPAPAVLAAPTRAYVGVARGEAVYALRVRALGYRDLDEAQALRIERTTCEPRDVSATVWLTPASASR